MEATATTTERPDVESVSSEALEGSCGITGGACSIAGQRAGNQDAAFVWVGGSGDASPVGFAAVGDGVGGYAGGEVASRIAVATLTAVVQGGLRTVEAVRPETLLLEGFRKANAAVALQAEENPEFREMATTLTAALVHAGVLHVAGIGDSRAYLQRNNELRQLTRDDSHVQDLVDAGLLARKDAKHHRLDNFITRCLGIGETVNELAVARQALLPGDIVVISSDGFHKFAEEALMRSTLCPDPTGHARELVEAALEAGSDDNITTAILWFGNPGMRPDSRRTLSYW